MTKNITADLDIALNPSLAELQTHMQRTCDHHNWSSIGVESTFLLFTEEVGELAKAIRKTLKIMDEPAKGTKTPEQVRENLAEELADCLGYVLDLANRLDVDLGAAYQKKVRENLERSWKY